MAKYIVQHRRGTAAQWSDNSTIIPKEGELVIEIDEANSLHKLKIGDGIHTYAELAYLMAGDEVVTQVLAKALPRVVTVTLDVGQWTEVTSETDPNFGYYKQTITIDNITAYSRLDLQPDADMLTEFKNLNLVFTTENKNGGITVYSVGDMPLKSYTMQATIIETELDVDCDKIVGMPVGHLNSVNETNGYGYCTCNTIFSVLGATTTKAGTASLPNYKLVKYGFVAVKFTFSVVAGATLNINNTGAISIYYNGTTIKDKMISAGDIALFVYDGSHYQLLGTNNLVEVAALAKDLAKVEKLDPDFIEGLVTDVQTSVQYTNKLQRNFALNKPTTASSCYSDVHTSDKAVNGRISYTHKDYKNKTGPSYSYDAWASSTAQSAQWLKVDLQGYYRISNVAVTIDEPGSRFKLQGSFTGLDDGYWVDLSPSLVTTKDQETIEIEYNNDGQFFRYVRVYFESIIPLPFVHDLEVYGWEGPDTMRDFIFGGKTYQIVEATAGSIYNSNYTAGNAINHVSGRWAAYEDYDYEGEFLQVKIPQASGQASGIRYVSIQFELYAAYKFDVQYSSDGVSWTTFPNGSYADNTSAVNNILVDAGGIAETTAKNIRVLFHAGSHFPSIQEITVYGD